MMWLGVSDLGGLYVSSAYRTYGVGCEDRL